ncbi:uncharacterized protein F4807DRAFT_470839 [Annulohypoxylon truncatum]|uniref:uncharacterized protein n=1 Tax=Annulohypoxylon truncatum TaxID=327061 RepID=UPI0020086CBE|nr:uncharacterized protein F4807DRAFT_470839 [Annulohypoxylon truncatum]KAI1213542.1 hypothetical protein F4807DRAFT_470839 [Annulohypoxylon truncatum]
MYSLRRAYEPIGTILDPVSPHVVARDTLQNLTFIFLAINASVSFTLIMATLCTVARNSKPIRACSITYVVLFLLTIAAGSFLYLRVKYFKSHPLPPTPMGPNKQNMEGSDYLNSQNQPGAQQYTQADDFQDVELGDIGTHQQQVPDPYDQNQYYSPYPQDSHNHVGEGNMTEESISPAPERHRASHYRGDSDTSVADLTSNYASSSLERNSRESFTGYGNGQDAPVPSPISQHSCQEARYAPKYSKQGVNHLRNANSVVDMEHKGRKMPFSPSLAQLSSWELGERRNYETLEEARADLRSNWRNANRDKVRH